MEGKVFLKKIEKEMEKCVVGKKDVIKLLTIALLSNGHVLLEGFPGIAKTTIAKNFAKVFGLKFSRIQLTPDTMASDIIGIYYYNQKTGSFEVKKGPIFANIVLADEINRTSPKTQSALLEAMQERQVTIEGKVFEIPKPFMLIATKNPIEHEGVYELPEAQMDRFMFKINLEYPKKDEEIEMLKKKHLDNFWKVNSVISEIDLKYAYIGVKGVHVSDEILEYIVNIVNATRTDDRLLYGASPRASEHLLYASKALAFLNRRDYVIPDDVKELALYILNHRIKVKAEYVMEGVSVKEVIEDILKNTEVPK
ncbi:AAA family ATPase [Methanocaldococcus sp. 28A]